MCEEQERFSGYSETIEQYRNRVNAIAELSVNLWDVHTDLRSKINGVTHQANCANQEFQKLSQFYLIHGEKIPVSDREFKNTLSRLDNNIRQLEEYREKKVRDLVEKLIRVM
jgi:prefoldin subunit 5